MKPLGKYIAKKVDDITEDKMTKANNTVNVLYPYRTKGGIWCFDDGDLDIIGEPFVGEINTIIDMYANGQEDITVFISSKPIHDQTLSLSKKEELGKGMYQLDGTNVTGWLCSCLLRYFPGYVDIIYAKIIT